jgi:hypothetical protein
MDDFKKIIDHEESSEQKNDERLKNHVKLMEQISWNENEFIKRFEAEGKVEMFYLQETLESLKVRTLYAQQQIESNVLLHYNENEYMKSRYLLKSAVLTTDILKCMICKKILIEKQIYFVFCKICKDSYHLKCFNDVAESERGRVFHNNFLENEQFQFNQNKSSNRKKTYQEMASNVYWVCQKCTDQIRIEERILFKLEFPFQIQQNPQIVQKINTLNEGNIITGNLTTYQIPDNLDEALKEKLLIFEDNCVFLTKAKQKHNSILFSREPIDVN